MAYGTIKVDTVTFTSEGIDTSVSISGLVRNPTFSGNITSTSTISGVTIQGGTLVSGATVTGSAGQFTTITGGTVNFTTITGTTAVITSGVFASGTAAAPSVSIGTTTNGIYSPGANQVAITTSGTGRLFVDASGNVGIGTSSPNNKLHVIGSGDVARFDSSTTDAGLLFFDSVGGSRIGTRSANLIFDTSSFERARIDSSGRLLVGTSSYDGNARAVFAGNTSDNATGAIDIRRNTARPTAADTQIGALRFISNDSTSSNYTYASIDVFTDGASSSNTDIPGRLVFSTTAGNGASSPTERMRVDSLGRTQLFSAGGNHVLRVASDQAAGTAIILIRGLYSATDNSTSGTESFRVFTNGNVVNSNNSYGAISDIKLKENIVDASSQWNDLKALQVRKYNFKEGQTHTQIGLVAQEVELVSPGLVNESPDRDEDGNDLGTVTKSVNYSVLYMKAVKALQEAMERIETLEQRLNNAGIN
jgi:hypothetical protein